MVKEAVSSTVSPGLLNIFSEEPTGQAVERVADILPAPQRLASVRAGGVRVGQEQVTVVIATVRSI